MSRKSSLQQSSDSSIPRVDPSSESTVRQTPEMPNRFRARPTLRQLAESQSPDMEPGSRPPANSAMAESTQVPSSNTYRGAANPSFQPHAVPRQSYSPR